MKAAVLADNVRVLTERRKHAETQRRRDGKGRIVEPLTRKDDHARTREGRAVMMGDGPGNAGKRPGGQTDREALLRKQGPSFCAALDEDAGVGRAP